MPPWFSTTEQMAVIIEHSETNTWEKMLSLKNSVFVPTMSDMIHSCQTSQYQVSPQSSLEHFSFILFHYDVCKRVLTFHAVAWFFSPSLALFLPACVCTDLLLSSCSSHNSQLIGSRSGHDTAERGSERDDGNSWARFPFSFSVETARAFSLSLLLLLSSLLILLPGFLSFFFLINFYRSEQKFLGLYFFFLKLFVLMFVFCLAGIDFKIKTVELQGKKIKLQIW